MHFGQSCLEGWIKNYTFTLYPMQCKITCLDICRLGVRDANSLISGFPGLIAGTVFRMGISF